jgi:hypothetical protein
MLETELFAFLEDTTEAIFAVQEQDGVCFWNHAAQTLVGYKSEKVFGKNCFAILQGVDSLGTQVCRDRLSILKCPKGQSDIPNFDLSVITFEWQASLDQPFNSDLPERTHWKMPHGAFGARHKRPEETGGAYPSDGGALQGN